MSKLKLTDALAEIDEYIRLRHRLAGLARSNAEGCCADHDMLRRCRDLVDHVRAEGYAKGFEAGQQSRAGEHG